MDKQSIVEVAVGLWLLLERFLTARKNAKLKEHIDSSVREIVAHVPALASKVQDLQKQAPDPRKPVTIYYDKTGPKRKK